MLTFEQIKELIDQVASHRLGGIELERSGFRLKIDGHKLVEAASAAPSAGTTPSSPALTPPEAVAASSSSHAAPESRNESGAWSRPQDGSSAPAAEEKDSGDDLQGAHILPSPIVGTFYRSPNPDSSPYAGVGDRVKAGQVLCIVEAMKLMNEIEADTDGTVVKVFVENAQPVEYGEPLFAIRAD